MNINLTGGSIDITDALRQYTTDKFSRLSRHFDHIINANVIFQVEKLTQKAEATLLVPGEEIYASSESSDLYSAIDLLVDKLDTQVKKHKEKIRDHRE
jgi:putative sigma-54 modulation protein